MAFEITSMALEKLNITKLYDGFGERMEDT
jgi:hypothetical protein